jgi:hypothetical protein
MLNELRAISVLEESNDCGTVGPDRVKWATDLLNRRRDEAVADVLHWNDLLESLT